MQRFLYAAIVAALTYYCQCIYAQSIDTMQKLPSTKWNRVHIIDVKHIVLNLQFDWLKKQAYGTATISFVPYSATDKITLDAGMLTINNIKNQNEIVLKYQYDGSDKDDALQITLDRVYNAGEEVIVKIDYHTNYVNEIDPINLSGSNGKGLRFSQPTSNDPIKPKEIWSIGEPISNRYWFPCYDAPNDLRTTEFIARVDKKLTVISNGNLVKTVENANGMHTYHYKADIPYANHLTSFVVGEFTNVQQKYGEVQLNNFGNPIEKEWIEASTVRLPDMMKYFSESIGVKYPYKSYSQLFVQDIGSFTSNNMMAAITENMIDDYPTHADYFYLWDLTEAEALAQQWFGNYITAQDWSEAWLNKSFAHYMNALYNEHKNGKDEFLIWQHNFDQGTYLFDWNSGNRRPIVTKNYEDVNTMANDNYTATRGALVLHMLRKYLGDANWWKAMHYYVTENASTSVTTEDFRKAVEKASGEPMDWFFDQWLYKMGHPVFEVNKKYDATKKQLTLLLKQTQKQDSLSAFPQTIYFKGKMDIEIDNKIEQVWIEDNPENRFTFSLENEPKLINVDYENTWIKELRFEKTIDEYLYEFQFSKDILARQAAMLELVNGIKSETATAAQKLKVKDALCLTATSTDYWRLRLGAVTQLQYFLSLEKNDTSIISCLLTVINNEKSWLKASAIRILGNTNTAKYADIYLQALNDSSERVVAAAALALAKTKSKITFDALVRLTKKPSMKSQSLLSAFAAFKELGDKRAYKVVLDALKEISLPRWRLPTPPVWDFRISAAETLASLGKGNVAFPLILERFKKSMRENDINGIFNNVLIIAALADARGQEAFDLLKKKFKDDANAMMAVEQIESQFKNVAQNLKSKK